MKVAIIGHPIAVQGFALVGVQGQAVTSIDEVNKALDEALAAKDIGIILITQDVSAMIESRMDQLRMHSTVPLVVEIPGPEGTSPDQPSLNAVIQRAIGIKL
jgi:V/A-type H+-transporting ATPase subunit F